MEFWKLNGKTNYGMKMFYRQESGKRKVCGKWIATVYVVAHLLVLLEDAQRLLAAAVGHDGVQLRV